MEVKIKINKTGVFYTIDKESYDFHRTSDTSITVPTTLKELELKVPLWILSCVDNVEGCIQEMQDTIYEIEVKNNKELLESIEECCR